VGADVFALHDNVAPEVSPANNEAGWREALTKLGASAGVDIWNDAPSPNGAADAKTASARPVDQLADHIDNVRRSRPR
jgi:hypothetical protein